MSQSLLQVDSYGGAINRRTPGSTAVPQRGSILKLPGEMEPLEPWRGISVTER
jgi:hypothetical protein